MDARAGRAARIAARLGLVGRTVFYLLLAFLAVQIAVDRGRGGRQANAHGALSVIAQHPGGVVAIAATAVGFLAFGVVRVVGAVRDRDVPTWRRVTTALQGLFYVALTSVPASFVFGRRQTGSEQQQHRETAAVLRWPLGRELVGAVGLIFVLACLWQIRTGLKQDFTDGMNLRGRPRWLRRLVEIAGVVGIPARALVFLPVGVFLVVAAVQMDPQHADGLDAELALLARHSWGLALLALVALGLIVFAGYSALEARYREVESGE